MSDHGYVYVLMNPSMEGMVKVGKTQREPKDRAKELSSTTGVPTPFVVVYESYFESCSDAEDFVHTYLGEKGYRVSKNREFFEISAKVAIDALIEASNHFGEFSKEASAATSIVDSEIFSENSCDPFFDDLELAPIEPWAEAFDKARRYYWGFDDDIQDYEEAMVYFIKAIKLGSLEAYERVGSMYRRGEGVSKNTRKALQFFKEGAKKGYMECYGRMAEVFTSSGNMENARKCWAKFFEQDGSMIDPSISHSYMIYFVFANDFKLEYVDKLKGIADQIIAVSVEEIKYTKEDIENETDSERLEMLNDMIIDIEGEILFLSEALT